ncbi:MAG: glycoside hydrolase family 3 N-terminal domain-containing protein, partial [Planctomycetota bacterium]
MTMTDLARCVATGLPGTELDDSTRRLLDAGISALILFSRNIIDPEQVAALTTSLRAYAGRPLLIMVDQEGGRVQRLRQGFTSLPCARALGATADEGVAEAVGGVLGTELRAVGINMALAPVVDVDSNPANPVIGDRALGRDPALV